MKTLICASKSILLYDFIKNDVKEFYNLKEKKHFYYGCHFSNENIFIGLRHSSKRGEILILDYNLKIIGSIKDSEEVPFTDIHQVVYHEEKLWIVSTLYDEIIIYNFKDKTFETFLPAPKSNKNDHYHFNSIFFDEKNFYILANNVKDKNNKSYVYVFDIKTREKIESYSLGINSHCLWYDNGKFFTLSSKEKLIINNVGEKYKIHNNFMIRGASILINENKFIVGCSNISDRKDRPKSCSYLQIFDKNYKFLKLIELGQYGNVHDIRTPGHFDLGSIHILGKKINYEIED